MKIGCLQFAPRVGDIENNLTRADAVLCMAKDKLKGLDLLVLPELAFTATRTNQLGFNFRSQKHITPHLEPAGSGISALWARTRGLERHCNVIVGYPAKVDVAAGLPTSPKFYNSAFFVDGDGNTIADYRKSFLNAIDKTWALEGQDGFFVGQLPALGNVALGISTDINWHAFGFAFHALDANVVVVTMAWTTSEDPRSFTQLPDQPDLGSLEHWVKRLQPIIHAEKDEEIIVVFCNRTGVEDNVVYAGTSTVIGVKHGKVYVYGILGRGVREVLVVDTTKGPIAELVIEATEELSSSNEGEQDLAHSASTLPQQPTDATPSLSLSHGISSDARAETAASSTAASRTSAPNIATTAGPKSPRGKLQNGSKPQKLPRLQLPTNGSASTTDRLTASSEANAEPPSSKEEIPTSVSGAEAGDVMPSVTEHRNEDEILIGNAATIDVVRNKGQEADGQPLPSPPPRPPSTKVHNCTTWPLGRQPESISAKLPRSLLDDSATRVVPTAQQIVHTQAASASHHHSVDGFGAIIKLALSEGFFHEATNADANHGLTQASTALDQHPGVVKVHQHLGAPSGVAALEDAAADEDAVATERHHEGGIDRGGRAASGKGQNRDKAPSFASAKSGSNTDEHGISESAVNFGLVYENCLKEDEQLKGVDGKVQQRFTAAAAWSFDGIPGSKEAFEKLFADCVEGDGILRHVIGEEKARFKELAVRLYSAMLSSELCQEVSVGRKIARRNSL